MRFIRNLRMQGLLSFPPDMRPFELQDLNVLIGPNGSGKSNITEAIELVRATATVSPRRYGTAAGRLNGSGREKEGKGSPGSR